jgi:hypothetical protein
MSYDIIICLRYLFMQKTTKIAALERAAGCRSWVVQIPPGPILSCQEQRVFVEEEDAASDVFPIGNYQFILLLFLFYYYCLH